MKPINLQGHSRPIKKVKFNESGELLFTASSDRTIVSWSIPSGEKQITFNHSAAINTFCVTNKHLISGDNTGTIYIWEISTGKILKKLEHDPTLSVRSLDYLQNDHSQIMVVYAGRAKLAKSFISIYNINDIINYGENKTEEKKSNSLIDITSEALKEMKKLSLPDEKKEGDSENLNKGNTNTNTESNNNANNNNDNKTNTNTNPNTFTNMSTNTTNSNTLKNFADNLMSANNTNNNNTLIQRNLIENNNFTNFEQKPKPSFTPGKSIYDEENSIYAIYANKPKEPINNNQNSNYKFAGQDNFNGYNNNNNYGAQQGYNFNNNNNNYNGGFYNQNQQMGQGQQQGNFRFNNNNNNFNNNFNNRNNNYNNNQYQNNNMQNNLNNNNNGSIYNNNNNGSIYNNNNNNNINQNQQNQNQNTGGFQRNLNFQNNNNLFNPLKGNSFDPNPSIIQRPTADPAKITVSFEKIIPMKQIEIQNTANTKYVAAKFFSYNDKLCIAVSKENGFFEFINYVSSKVIHEEKLHTEIIFDFDFDSSENLFLTVSKDGTACVYDFDKYKIIKTFKPENPVRFLNACKICKLDKNFEETVKDIKNGLKNSNMDSKVKNNNDNLNGNEDLKENLNTNQLDKFVFLIAGGQDSKLVTTTKEGGFEIIGFNMEMEESIFMHLANFGPVNTIDLSKKKNFFVSGSEDSSVKLINFDQLLVSNGNEKK
jgi:WD40 repeat protein